ncbi:MAG: RNA polymerase sigma factor [Bacteroidales bacterium]
MIVQVEHALLTDEEVARRVLLGETPLFEILMRRYNQRLFRVVRGIIRDDSEAEDVVQEAYVNAYTHLDQFAGRAKLSTWLTRIAVNEALARARRGARLDPLETGSETGDLMDTLKSRDPDPERQAVTGELRATLESAIDNLPPLYRSVMMMREVEELSTAETAECLGITEEAVKVRLHRARGMLRAKLEDLIGHEAPNAFRFDGARCDRIVRGVMERIGERR